MRRTMRGVAEKRGSVRGVGNARRRRRAMSLRNPELLSVLLAGDVLVTAIAAWVAPDLWALFDEHYVATSSVPYWQAASIVLWVVALRVAGGSDLRSPRRLGLWLSSIGQALIALTALVLVLFYVSPFFAPRGSTFISLPLVAATLVIWRAAFARLLGSRLFDLDVAIVGTDSGALQTARFILESTHCAYRLRAFLVPSAETASISGVPVLNVGDDLWARVRELGIEQLIVGHTQSLPPAMLNDLVRCFEHDVQAVPATAIYEELSGRVLATALEADWYAELPTHARGLYASLKRTMDFALGTALLLVALPVMALVALTIWLDSGRPVLLRQIRVGRRGSPFVMHKFRTMRRDAEQDGQAVWATIGDPRVTRVGRSLRRSRLDELPQLWDVARGAMSLIGPRPERPEFAERLSTELPLFRARTLVRPGITGWAQVEYRYAGSIADNLTKLEYDLYYLRHIGPLLDLKIALRTVFIAFGLRGQ